MDQNKIERVGLIFKSISCELNRFVSQDSALKQTEIATSIPSSGEIENSATCEGTAINFSVKVPPKLGNLEQVGLQLEYSILLEKIQRDLNSENLYLGIHKLFPNTGKLFYNLVTNFNRMYPKYPMDTEIECHNQWLTRRIVWQLHNDNCHGLSLQDLAFQFGNLYRSISTNFQADCRVIAQTLIKIYKNLLYMKSYDHWSFLK